MTTERLIDAKVLLDGGRWNYAYYVVGYAIECALKACLLNRMVETGWVFQEKVKIEQCLTHNFAQLVECCGLRATLDNDLKASKAAGTMFKDNWGTAEKWTVTSRYETKTETEARELYSAINDDPDGVLKWIQIYW